MRGGVEVLLRVFQAETKKNAILWTPNYTVVPARGGHAREFMVFLIYGKVTLSSVTEYIFSSRGAGQRREHISGACLVLPGCCILLANGLRFQSSEADLGSWLASGLTGRSGGAVMKHFLKCILLSARMTWLFDALTGASSLQVGSCSAWVAMLKCGDSLPMANVVQLTIGATPLLSLTTV